MRGANTIAEVGCVRRGYMGSGLKLDTVSGEWCDVPGGKLEGNITGSLTLKIINNDRLEKVTASPAYGGSVWTRLYWDASP